MHATLTYFEFVSVEYAIINVDFPIFVETFLLNGGLNLMIFLLCCYTFDGLCLWFYILVLYCIQMPQIYTYAQGFFYVLLLSLLLLLLLL